MRNSTLEANGLLLIFMLPLIACSESDPQAAQGTSPTTEAATPEQESRPVEEATSNGDTFHMRCLLPVGGIPLNEDFDLEIQLSEAADGRPIDASASLAIAARMPAHGHGMKQAPTIEQQPNGRWRIEGMLFHMSGRWELHCDLTRGAITERAQLDFDLE